MRYEDFSIRITSAGQDGYKVIVTESPMGSGESVFQFPFELEDIAALLGGVAGNVRGGDATPGEASRSLSDEGDARDLPSPRELGVLLFNALFQGRVKSMFDQSLGRLQGYDDDVGLRIRLQTDLTGAGASHISSLPWELMSTGLHDPPLTVSRRTPLVRDLDVNQPQDPALLKGTLNILAILSNPIGTAHLDLETEKKRIQEKWAQLKGVDVDFVEPNLPAIRNHLAKKAPHVIHYMGHGDFDPKTGRGVLLFENADRTPRLVSGEDLEVLIGDEQSLRLVFMNACKTAVATETDSLDPFAGIATTLIKIGVPAVIAMQFPITDDAAIQFADVFYRRIVDGMPVDSAVGEARKALWPNLECITPVLFMRSKDGVIFVQHDDEPAPAPRSADPPGQSTSAPQREPSHATPAPVTPKPTPTPVPSRPWGKIGLAGAGAVAAAVAAFMFLGPNDIVVPLTDPPKAEELVTRVLWAQNSATIFLNDTAEIRFDLMQGGEQLGADDLADVEAAGLNFVLDDNDVVAVASASLGAISLVGLSTGSVQAVIRALDRDGQPYTLADGRTLESPPATFTVEVATQDILAARNAADSADALIQDESLPDAEVLAGFQALEAQWGRSVGGEDFWQRDVSGRLEDLDSLTAIGARATAADPLAVLAADELRDATAYVDLNTTVRGGSGATFSTLQARVEALTQGLAAGGTVEASGPLQTCSTAPNDANKQCTSGITTEFRSDQTVHYSFRASKARFRVAFFKDGAPAGDPRTVGNTGRYYAQVRGTRDNPGAWEIRLFNTEGLLVARHEFTVQ